jgi:hypothetical protein
MHRVILGRNDQYHIQTNDGSVELFERYTGRKKMVSCGPTMAAMNFDIARQDMSVFTPGEQASDSIMMVMHNPNHLGIWKSVRDIDYSQYSPNEVPQLYPELSRIIFGVKACHFSWGITWEKIKGAINWLNPVGVAGEFPMGGHYISVVGYIEGKTNADRTVIINDPYPTHWIGKAQKHQDPSRPGFRRYMPWAEFTKRTVKSGRDFMLVFHTGKLGAPHVEDKMA